MDFSRINFGPIALGGDDVTGALRKLDQNFGGLGDASKMQVGVGPGTVAAGDDDRLGFGLSGNRVINPSFDIWQRGAGPFNVGYTADRWLMNNAGNAYTIDRYAVLPGTTTSRSVARATIVSVAADSSYSTLQQRIEGVDSLAGRRVTVSFVASSSIDGKRIGVNLEQYFGVGGSSGVQVVGQAAVLTGAFKRYTFFFDVPAIAGKTLGAVGTDFIEVIIWMDAGQAFASRSGGIGQQSATVYVGDIEVKEGHVETPFQRRSACVELQMCQRFYEKSYDVDVKPGSVDWAGRVAFDSNGIGRGTTIIASEDFKVAKRKSPAITAYSPIDGAVGKAAQSDSTNTGLGVRVIGQSGFEWFVNNPPGAGGAYFQWTADSEL